MNGCKIRPLIGRPPAIFLSKRTKTQKCIEQKIGTGVYNYKIFASIENQITSILFGISSSEIYKNAHTKESNNNIFENLS